MTDPVLAVRASGYGGRGYKNPITGEVVPGITTVCKYVNNDGLVQWAVDQTAAWACTNVDALLNRTEEQGWGFLRFYWKRTPDLTEPGVRTAHRGVLNDAAELGTQMHEYMQNDITGDDFLPPIDSPEMAQMVAAWEKFKSEHWIEPVLTEKTIWGGDYAGTFDELWYIDGELCLLDTKTARGIREGHLMQLAALRRATQYFEREGSKWVLKDLPKPTRYGFIQIRPDDYDYHGNKIPAFCELHYVDEDELDIYLRKFDACKVQAYADAEIKALRRAKERATIASTEGNGGN